MSRRQFGTIRRLPSGRWQARYRVEAGQLVAAPQTFPTKAVAARWLATVEADQERHMWIDPRAGAITLEEYATAWLRDKVRISERTREIYDVQLRCHILPTVAGDVPPLGPVALANLTPEHIRSWYSALTSTNGESAAAKAYVRLRQILTEAVHDDRLAKNPCRIEFGGVEHHAEQRFASLAELYKLAGAVPERYRALVLVAGLGGLRQGELFALRRHDVDLVNGSVRIERKRLRLASGEVIEGDPKSAAGKRTVALPGPVVEELAAHITRFVGREATSFVFTSETGLPLERSNFRFRVWDPATKAVGVEGLRFHDLRHTAGTLAAQTGATTKELMARLGHGSPRAAMIYQHATRERDRRIADRLADMIDRDHGVDL